ncbi:MAG: DUF547 domain-containing protein [Geminicoccaceae bacterium]
MIWLRRAILIVIRPSLVFTGVVAGLGLASMVVGSSTAKAAPDAKLWARWEAHAPASDATIDHGAWGDLLSRYLVTGADGINRFAYGDVKTPDKSKLDRYLQSLAETKISEFGRAEQMAYWINLYNALTTKVVLDHYPVSSIRDIDISPGFFSDGPWGKKLLTIEGERVALDDIEHQILRPIWRDPRVHYAVNCASIGCPNLQPSPFEGAKLDRQLDEAAIDFINHQRDVDLRDGELTVSSIYRWFSQDFGGSDREILAHLKAFASPALAMKLEDVGTIDDDRYDWRLNDVAKGS